MAHYHSLSSFALSCGLTPEIDTLQECLSSEGAEFSSNPPSAFMNPALGVGRRRDNSECETPQTDSEPLSPEPVSPPADSRTGHYMVQYYLNSKLLQSRKWQRSTAILLSPHSLSPSPHPSLSSPPPPPPLFPLSLSLSSPLSTSPPFSFPSPLQAPVEK